ncbi:unnamed protein product [Ambrosiozyma monospora]|uniref:Unnamed protein product n=1 Tax=Ambrosiozyma monospora TaxID=43982 RepID=A0ACB5UBR1_AMBMO|nr:unnamed protein product [Ambrosiozyma monospora]
MLQFSQLRLFQGIRISLIKKFENKLKIHSKCVNGLDALKLAQKSGKIPFNANFQDEQESISDIFYTVQADHLTITFPVRNYAPQNNKIKFLELTGSSYEGTRFDGLTPLLSLSVGSKIHMKLHHRWLGDTEYSRIVHIN